MPETKRSTVTAVEEILGGYFPVLDHGFVSLVDYMGTDEDIERAARVSYGFGTRQTSQTRGLVRYLRRHKHTTPTEMVELKFHCCMPMFVARQWIRHRTANVNEYSGRYSLLPLLFYTPTRENFAFQSSQNNQGRGNITPEALYGEALNIWDTHREHVSADYAHLITENVAKELARIDLPLSTYTQWYWKIDLHNLLHFLTLRADAHAQYEIRAYAEVMAGMVKRIAPLSYEAWIDYQVAGVSLSRGEIEALRTLLHPTETSSIITTSTGTLSKNDLTGRGLSEREIAELLDKLKPHPLPNFELDLSKMVSAEVVQRAMEQAVPKIDQK